MKEIPSSEAGEAPIWKQKMTHEGKEFVASRLEWSGIDACDKCKRVVGSRSLRGFTGGDGPWLPDNPNRKAGLVVICPPCVKEMLEAYQ